MIMVSLQWIGCGGVPRTEPAEPTPGHDSLSSLCDRFEIELAPGVVAGKRLTTPMPRPTRKGAPLGIACIHATITVDGLVTEPKVVYSTNESFARSFLEVLREWRLEPATLEGSPVEIRTLLVSTYTRH